MTFIRNITFRFYFILVLIYVLSIEVPEALCRQLFLLDLGICLFCLVHALASLWVTKKLTMHNTRMEKQINLINTFKMTMISPFFIFKSYLNVKRSVLGDLDLVQNKSLPNCFVTRKHYKTRYYMIICKVLKFSFLDGGQFGGHFEFINPQFF